MDVLAKTRNLGGSLIVTIPKNIVQHENIMPGEIIRIDVQKIRKDYLGSLPGLGPLTKEDKLDTHD